jgi:hypothetical protein
MKRKGPLRFLEKKTCIKIKAGGCKLYIEQSFQEKSKAVKGDLKTYTSRKKPPSERHLTLESFGSSA